MSINKAFSVASVVTILGSLVVACSSTTTTTTATPETDSGTHDSGVITPRDSGPGTTADTGTGTTTDSGTDSDAGTDDLTVGTACTANTDCEKVGPSDKFCSAVAFKNGTLFPTPICVGTCDYDTTSQNVQFCDGDLGICIGDATGGTCFAACSIDDTGAAPQGCLGKNLCSFDGAGPDSTGKIIGVGVCFGGCAADADCTGGDKCQVETGLCVKALVAYTKLPGAACTGTSDTTCNCQSAGPTTPGLCTSACKTAATAQGPCATGFVCTADLPKGDGLTTGFTKQPVGMSGTCRKTCTTDTDCGGAPNGWCAIDDLNGSVCIPGAKPASTGG